MFHKDIDAIRTYSICAACRMAGSATKLAEILKVKRGRVSHWVNKGKK